VVVKALTAHPVATVKDTARRRRVPPGSLGHNSLVLDEVLLGSKCWVRVHYIILYDDEKIFGMSMSLCTHAMLSFRYAGYFLSSSLHLATLPPYSISIKPFARVHPKISTRFFR
jgi:hypothetical protein